MIEALKDERRYSIPAGFMDTLLKLLGFHISFYRPEWLGEECEWLLTVQHVDDDSTVLIPIRDFYDDFDKVLGTLLETQTHKMPVMYALMASMGGSHEEGVTELDLIRQRKEAAIMAQDFDLAADLRDLERGYLR